MKKTHIFFIVFILISVGIFSIISINGKKNNEGRYDEFAKCLTEKGVKIWGASWCSHCQNQKKMFGKSWQYVNYIECALSNGQQAQVCKDESITGYPTWQFPDGKRESGELTLAALSVYSGCELKLNE